MNLSPSERPLLLDLFCGIGGAAMGYHRAGFDVIGIDIAPQPHFPFEFYAGDAREYLLAMLERPGRYLDNFSAIHASPPCQAFSKAQRLRDNEHPDLIAPIRDLLIESGLPYVIENVPGSPLREPIELCGAMFPPLKVYRHRLFETSFTVPQPPHVPHTAPQVKMGRVPQDGEWIQAVGNFSGADEGREAMGMPWATRDELAEAVPPAYTEWVGRFLMAEVREPQRSLAA